MLVPDFVNTLELDPLVDELDSPEALSSWLADRGLVAPGYGATEAELRETIEVREALRALLAAQNGLPADVAGASATLDAASRKAGLSVRFADGAARLEPEAQGTCRAVGAILAEVAEAMADGSWSRLKACRCEDCLWVFEDTSKNRSRVWCSMGSCGNREKARVYRARHLGSSSSRKRAPGTGLSR